MNQEQYKIMFKEVDEIINSIFTEFWDTIELLKNDNKFIKMRLLIAFSFVEVICGIFDKFYNLNLGNEDLMKKWLKNYCFNEKNEIYREHRYIKNLDENYFYKLRCSIIHAFALPEQEDKNAVIFINENVASLDNFNALKRIRGEFYRRGAKKIKLNGR